MHLFSALWNLFIRCPRNSACYRISNPFRLQQILRSLRNCSNAFSYLDDFSCWLSQSRFDINLPCVFVGRSGSPLLTIFPRSIDGNNEEIHVIEWAYQASLLWKPPTTTMMLTAHVLAFFEWCKYVNWQLPRVGRKRLLLENQLSTILLQVCSSWVWKL